MKKLKIFLLLSILLCFGFALNSKVHAQGDGPKIFEVGDVLPATTQLKIHVYVAEKDYSVTSVNKHNGIYIAFFYEGEDSSVFIKIGGVLIADAYVGEFAAHYYIVDTSNLTLEQRTITYVDEFDEDDFITWEDLNASSGYSITFEENGGTTQTDLTGQTALPDPLPIPTKENYTFVGWYYDDDLFYEALAGDPLTDDVTLYARWVPGKLFQVGDVLPATTELKIRIYFKYGDYDYHLETVARSGIYLSIDWISGARDYLDFYIEIGGNPQYDGEVNASSIYYTIDISNWSLNQRTIKSVSFENGSFATWEDTTPDGYTQGYLTAREEYGYYDPNTDQWLSVEEYLERYGTDKMGQSDFYGNFDKYFIPAMIIVFGGAILITVLKVFKGRE